jgi:type I restriction enzyme R subunit
VVDKLLTGFDAPSCTYLYIDKSMQDHGLFQAICRTNRLDGDDKDFGYIVDYKDLFKKVEKAIAVYSSELDQIADGIDPQILLKERLADGRERLDAALEVVEVLCEPVEPPKGELEHIRYFCGNTESPDSLSEHEPQRVALYKAAAGLLRAYANIADELPAAGYSEAEIASIKSRVERSVNLREIIRKASGETIDLKAYEADMRHLIDTYIDADEPKKISPFDDVPLLELIVKSGIAEAINSLPEGIRANKDAVAETIANNVRSKIIKEHLNDPAYFDRMSQLLAQIIADLKAKRLDYATYLRQIADLAKRVQSGKADDTPPQLNTPGVRAIYNNLAASHIDAEQGGGSDQARLNLALAIHDTVRRVRPDDWRGVNARELQIKAAISPLLNDDEGEVERIFTIIRQQGEY